MNGYVLDTSFVSAFGNKADSNHETALEIVKEFDTNLLILIPVVVLAEISRIKISNLRERALDVCLETFDSILEVEESNIEEYLDSSKKLPKSCTAIDSLLLYFAIAYDCNLVTFDKGLLRLV